MPHATALFLQKHGSESLQHVRVPDTSVVFTQYVLVCLYWLLKYHSISIIVDKQLSP